MTPPLGTLTPAGPSAQLQRADGAVPARALGLELLGELGGSGYRHPPRLVRRGDGQTVQLTPLLHGLLAHIDGTRGDAEIAAALSASVGRDVTADDVRFLIESKLRPLGLLRCSDGSEPVLKTANPLLALRWKLVVSDPAVTRRITAPFAALFHPAAALPLTAGFLLTAWWVLMDKGLGAAAHQAFHDPGMLLLVFGLTLLSAGFHEFGHAAACRYGGATPGAMGFGVYLVWPAFYTDVTDSYRLGRAGRLRVDVGGLYFNAVFSMGVLAVWALLRWDALLLLVAAQILQMLRQLLPFVRFDGYHILADLTGVPDLFARVQPTLRGLLPGDRQHAAAHDLKPWVRVVVTGWVLVVVPLLAGMLVLMVLVLPRMAATAWEAGSAQWAALTVAWDRGAAAEVGARLLTIASLGLPLLFSVYLLARVVRRTARRVARFAAGSRTRRWLAVVGATAVAGALAWAWWPGEQYLPIPADEDGRLFDLVPVARLAGDQRAPRPGLAGPPLTGPTSASLQAAPARDEPTWALIVRPRSSAGAVEEAAVLPLTPAAVPLTLAPAAGRERPLGWPFPFLPPDQAGEGDNRAFGVNTTDGATVYEIALALVWPDDGDLVHRNEAFAFASCRDCRTVAIAFQVVLAVGPADIVAPVNAAVAANYDCVRCMTHALAVQLVATLTDVPDDDVVGQIEAVWRRLERYSTGMSMRPLAQVHADLRAFEVEILEILTRAEPSPAPMPQPTAGGDRSEPGGMPAPTPAPPAPELTTAPTTAPVSEQGVEPSAAPDVHPSPAPSPEPSAEPTAAPTLEPSAEPAPAPSAEPAPAPSAEPPTTPSPQPPVEPTAAPSVEPSTGPAPEPSSEPTGEASPDPADVDGAVR